MVIAHNPGVEPLGGILGLPLIVRDPAPNDPDVQPVRDPEPEPDSPEPDPEPGDEPGRIGPVKVKPALAHSFLATGYRSVIVAPANCAPTTQSVG